ncbi:alpha/beta fold hydrolase [Treponema pedis]|uniref:alpha/beta fold hydrolase n=1 Tax=Treponema pedis TaxID=409322 RepID=UPI00041E0F59|nr:alpha/beta hydrolase [Treponema pedis]
MKCIMLHGLGQSSASWKQTIDTMNNGVINGGKDIDCPDLFTLVKDKEINYADLYCAFSEYCKRYSEPIRICGLSLGGILALHYTIENSDKVNALALIGVQYAMPKMLLKAQNIIFSMLPEKVFKKTGLKKKELIHLSDSMIDLDFRRELCKITCPALIICGEKDRVNMKAALRLKTMLPNAELNIIKKAGHEVNKDNPIRLGEVLNGFLR